MGVLTPSRADPTGPSLYTPYPTEANMTEQEVVKLMESSQSEQDWDNNCDRVKAACKGYPQFWFRAIVQSGLMNRVIRSFGGQPGIQVTALTDTGLRRFLNGR